MFLIKGKRTVRLKHDVERHIQCGQCRSFDIDVSVYRKYFHIFWIPFFPIGKKWAEIHCNNCGYTGFEAEEKEAIAAAKTPAYFFSGLILVALLIVWALYTSANHEQEKKQMIASPKVNDVYQVKDASTKPATWYFLKLVSLRKDSVVLLHSHLDYSKFTTRLSKEDYFEKNDSLYYSRTQLVDMLSAGKIYTIYRNYSSYKGFEKMK